MNIKTLPRVKFKKKELVEPGKIREPVRRSVEELFEN
jgi:hypothetical protein